MTGARSISRLITEIPSLVGGLKKRCAGKQLTVRGRVINVDEAIPKLLNYVTLREAVKPAKGVWQKTVQDAKDAEPEVAELAVDIEDWVRMNYGDQADALADFNMKPHKPRKPSLKARAAGVDKSIATREARLTLPKKEKAKIHGAAPAPVTSPDTKPKSGS
jgi:hypothetical protein